MIKYVNTNRLNFRTGPKTTYPIIDVLNKYQEVEIIEEGEWSKIRCLGREGYVHSKYISNTMYVNTPKLNFRKGSSIYDKVISTLEKDTPVEIIDEKDGWCSVIHNGLKGYLYSKYLTKEEPKIIKYRYVSVDGLNFRKGPGASEGIIKVLKKNDKVKVLDEGTWSKIKFNNIIGYVYSKYLNDNKVEMDKNKEDDKNKEEIYKFVNVDGLNFRKGPSVKYDVIQVLDKNDKVRVIKKDTWFEIEFKSKIGYVHGKYLSNNRIIDNDKIEKPSKEDEKIDKILSFAKKFLGAPYVWGAAGPYSFDCSGYVKYVFSKHTNLKIPRVSRDQSKFGEYVNLSDIKKGDLLFFDTDKDGTINHVGIYLGDGAFIHASSGNNMKVVISTIDGYYKSRCTHGRRLKVI